MGLRDLRCKQPKKVKKNVEMMKIWSGQAQAMLFKAVLSVCLLVCLAASQDLSFRYNGFRSANLSLDGIAEITSSGLLRLTNDTKQEKGHAFFPNPITFKNTNGSVFTFSTAFVFAIVPELAGISGHGIAFVIAPTKGLRGSLPSQYLGLFNKTNNGNDTNHVFAVELDTIYSSEFDDINDNHVGIDINGLTSEESAPAGYHTNSSGRLANLTLASSQPMQIWVEYDGTQKQLNITLAAINMGKPSIPLLSVALDLSPYLLDTMYVGFSSSTGSVLTSHYVLGWSYNMNGQAQVLDLAQLPKLPRIGPKERSKFLTIGVPTISVSVVFIVISGLVYFIRRKRKFAEVLEDWERDYGPHRFKYKDLYIATKGFRDKELLGSGGFGRVYRGVLPSSKIEIAVKKVSHETRQGMKVFVAEIVSIGRLRHRNLVTLLGYCRRKGELLLVYDCMPNGSLDKYLMGTSCDSQRCQGCNVLLDGELNGRLGDFGLARLYDHGTDQTTHVVGTLGYLAPEHTRTGKATTKTDVYAFGAFLLEVACGRRPIERREQAEDAILLDWVFSFWVKGEIIEARDQNLGPDYIPEEVELVLKLGLLCSHSVPEVRPSMRQVLQFLDRDIPLPELSSLGLSASGLTFAHPEGFSDYAMSYPSSMNMAFSHSSSVAESLLSGGR
ncbi:hypothetical protein GH714_014576 [Hevea brasiliensis]|uniref:non-specific serine/threonine protein kinase n=1 Tax=Hevea brasiliensis TaxID=3981 RepID=A0A6A6LSH1_HEVBR|nr:hypothetical protein GH714_014576 [Hevea brasiliensis]